MGAPGSEVDGPHCEEFAAPQEGVGGSWDWQSLDKDPAEGQGTDMPGAHTITTDRRRELADFLRGRRTRTSPSITRLAGLPVGRRRRTPGLRREELAQLAGLSVDWYTRLEQGRDVHPSRETLEAIARVLQLDDDERGHLFYLARPEHVRDPRPPSSARQEKPEPAMVRALQAMGTPALVMSPRFDVLAWNEPVERLLVPFGERAPGERNLLWMGFHDEALRARYADLPTVEKESVAAFRFNAGAFVGDPDFDTLITRMLETSESFRLLWARHEVRAKTGGLKAFRTDGEPLVLEWYSLASTTATQQQLVYYVTRTGAAPSDEARLARWLARP